MFLQHCKPLSLGKGTYPREIGRIGAVLARELVAAHIPRAALTGDERRQARLQARSGATAHKHAHFHALLRLRGREDSRSLDGAAFTAFQGRFCHTVTSPSSVSVCRRWKSAQVFSVRV